MITGPILGILIKAAGVVMTAWRAQISSSVIGSTHHTDATAQANDNRNKPWCSASRRTGCLGVINYSQYESTLCT